ncbi:MAG: heme ABC transporter permease [Rickettsiaceae bacterium]
MVFKFLKINNFQRIPYKYIITLLISTLLVMLIGLYYALFNSPIDYQQGDMVRVMYVHVPSAWMSLGIYTFISICSVYGIVWRTRISYLLAIAAAPIGCAFSIITLVTGSIWGKPIWGTWWVWDARLTSMLILFLFYLAYIIVVNSGDNILRAEKPAEVISIVGFINVPIVKFSVDLWHSLHQPSSIFRKAGFAIDNSMLKPLLIMFVSFILYFILLLIIRTNILIYKIKFKNLNNY